MMKMVKEIAGLCYQLDKLYSGEKDRNTKKEIGKNFDRMSDLLDRAIRSQFDENDTGYKSSVRKLRKLSRELKKESEALRGYERFFAALSGLGDQLSLFLSGRK